MRETAMVTSPDLSPSELFEMRSRQIHFQGRFVMVNLCIETFDSTRHIGWVHADADADSRCGHPGGHWMSLV